MKPFVAVSFNRPCFPTDTGTYSQQTGGLQIGIERARLGLRVCIVASGICVRENGSADLVVAHEVGLVVAAQCSSKH